MKQRWERVGVGLVRNVSSGIYYGRAWVDGAAVRKSLKTTKLPVARRRLSEWREGEGRTVAGDWSLDGFLAAVMGFYQSIPSYQSKPNSLRYRKNAVEVLRRTLTGEPVSWTAEDLRRWWCCDEVVGLSPMYRNNLLGTMRAGFRLMMEAGARADDPTARLRRVRVVVGEAACPSRKDFWAVVRRLEAGSRSQQAGFLVAWMGCTGMRIGEAVALCWQDVGEAEVTVRGGLTGTKNGHVRRVPLVADAVELLGRMERGEPGARVFLIDSPKVALRIACDALKVERFTAHSCRHFFATSCIESGVDIPTVAKWLGHRDGGALAMRIYGHLRNDHSAAAAARVSLAAGSSC